MNMDTLVGNPTTCEIVRRDKENDSTVTLYFRRPPSLVDARPGQFLMVWVPDVDEIPMSISYSGHDTAAITVQVVGEATHALASLHPGDRIGVRGPFGTHFSLDTSSPLVVGGGVGVAPLRFLVHELASQGVQTTVIVAARTSHSLLLYDLPQVSGLRLEVATDDGSMGFHGLAHELAGALMAEGVFDMVYACGPEPMLVSLVRLAEESGTDYQVSLERIMKCGCGICGSCVLDPTGLLVCKDGPVFTSSVLAEPSDFGMFYRDSTGRRLRF